MQLIIEVLVPEVPASVVPTIKQQFADILAGHGLTVQASEFSPQGETSSALHALVPNTFSTPAGTFSKPVAAIRVHAE